MKAYRVYVLMLLMLLVPIRGAWAALACHAPLPELTMVSVEAATHHDESSCHDSQNDEAADTDQTEAATVCLWCAGGCHSIMLAFTPPVLSLLERMALQLPDAVVSAWPSADLVGLKRPPRTI